MLENYLEKISDELTSLSKSTNLNVTLDKFKSVENLLSNANEQYNLNKLEFEDNEKNNDIIKNIDDETYEKFSKDITKIYETNWDKLNIETQIKKYKILNKKIKQCELYLKSKKLEIINCDKDNDQIINLDNDSDNDLKKEPNNDSDND